MESGVATARMGPPGEGARNLVLVPVIALLAAAVGIGLYLSPPPAAGLVLVGGLAFVGVIALTLARYEAAAWLGFALLGVVLVEPAPPDFVFLIVIAIAAVTGRVVLARVRPVVSLLLGTFLALNLISLIEVTDVARGMLFISITIYLIAFAVWLCTFVDSPRRARVVVTGYVFAATTSALIVVLGFALPIPGRDIVIYLDRGEGFFMDANVFGPFLIPAAAIMLQEAMEPRLLRLRPTFKLGIVAILLAGVLFSFSRGAWINAAAAILIVFAVMAIRRGGARRAGRMLALMLVLGAALVAVFSSIGSAQFLDQRASLQQYDTERFSAQHTGYELARESPLGIGPGQFEIVSPISTHSVYVRVLAEQGVLGFAVLLALLFVTLFLATQNALAGRSTYGIGSAALLGSWVGILVNSLVVDTIHWRHFWIVAALIWVGSMPYARFTGARSSGTTSAPPAPR